MIPVGMLTLFVAFLKITRINFLGNDALKTFLEA